MFRCESCGALNRVSGQGNAASAVCGKCKQSLDVSGKPQNVAQEAARRTIASSPIPVLVDVWATWCPPCRAVAPVLEALAKERAGKVITLKLDSDQNQQLASELRVQGIPTFVVFKDGKEVARMSGAMPKSALDNWLRQVGA